MRTKLNCLRMISAAVLLLAAFVPNGLRAAEPIKGEVSIDTSNGYVRMLFRMSEAVDVDARLSGNILIIKFAQPVALPVDMIASSAREYIAVARRDPDGAGIRMALQRKIRINKQMAGERVYIDLLPDTWSGILPGLPQDVVDDLAKRAREAERKLRQQVPVDRSVPTVRVKVGVQPTFLRYIFELPDGISVNTVKAADRLTLRFSKPVNYDLADTRDGMPSVLEAIDTDIDVDFASVNFRFTTPIQLRSFREDRMFVVDVPTKAGVGETSQEGTAPAQNITGIQAPETVPTKPGAAAPAAAQKPAAPAANGAPAIAAPAVTAPANAPAKPPAKTSAAPEPPKAPADAPPAAEPVRQRVSAAEPPRDDVPKAAPPAPPAEAAAALEKDTPAKPERSAETKPADTAASSKTVSNADTAEDESSRVRIASETAAPGAAVVKAAIRRKGENVTIVLPFANQTPVAVFRRDDTLWTVLDTRDKIDLSALENGKSFRGGAVTRPDEDTAVIRLKLDRPRLVSLTQDGKGWAITLGDKVEDPSRGLTVARNISSPQRSTITVPFEEPHKLHRLTDPEQGDELLVVTANGPARGFARMQEFVDLRALATVHGVAIQPLADDLVTELGGDKIVMSRPSGLVLSNVNSPAASLGSRTTLLDAQAWGYDRQANFNERQTELITKAAAAVGPKKLQARLDLARFFLARDLFPEAKSVLEVALDDKSAANDAGVIVMRAITNVMMDRPEDALRDLNNPAVGKQYDAQLWRALALAGQEHWAEARDSFRDMQLMIAALPIELQRLALMRSVRASIEVKDFAGAAKQMAEFETVGITEKIEPALAILNGRIAQGLGNDVDAIRLFHLAADSSDRGASAQGRLRELLMRYGKNELSRSDMIIELETLSSVWRGDETETESLLWLARLYTEENRYRDAFRLMRMAMMAHPNSIRTRQIQDEAAATFESLFLSGRSDGMTPVEALGLFYDYRELTPIGRRGDEMIRRLADRLAAVDLLDQATELLQHQVDHRLQGAARAQVATRLSVLYLMNRKPDRTLAVLRSTRSADLADEIRTQRLLIEARALSDVGRPNVALEVLEKMTTREAVRLRADILWGMKRWADAAEQIETLYGNRWKDFSPLNADERVDILRAGIGYALGDEAMSLARLRERYEAKMSDGPDRGAFGVVTAPSGASDAEFLKIANIVASVDTLSSFLREMRTRYPETGTFSRPGMQDGETPVTNSIRRSVSERQRSTNVASADMPTGSIARQAVVLPRPRPAVR